MDILIEKFKALPVRFKIYCILGAVLVVAGIIWGGLELALACERSAFEEKADALVEEKAKEMMKKINANSYKIEKRFDSRSSLNYTVTFDKYKPAEISAGFMPTFLLDIFLDNTPSIYTNWDRELETDLKIQKEMQEILKRLKNY
ncbi:MAG: hypothetical protein J6C40_05375 [Lentisphaeria bacterium]|nr:hypothetical protein [Lentisphaeria bacterium]